MVSVLEVHLALYDSRLTIHSNILTLCPMRFALCEVLYKDPDHACLPRPRSGPGPVGRDT